MIQTGPRSDTLTAADGTDPSGGRVTTGEPKPFWSRCMQCTAQQGAKDRPIVPRTARTRFNALGRPIAASPRRRGATARACISNSEQWRRPWAMCPCRVLFWPVEESERKLRAAPMIKTMHSFHSDHVSKKLSIETIISNASV